MLRQTILQVESLVKRGIASNIKGKCWMSSVTRIPETSPESSSLKLSKSMKAYLDRAREHDAFMFDQLGEYEIGRRHLANIMGENPETFSQEDVDEAIAYLFPSGLFEPKARPLMKHPSEVFPKRKAAEFDESGRPFHTMFYTGRPGYFQVLHEITGKIQELDHFSSRMIRYSVSKDKVTSMNLGSSTWVTKEQLEKIILENIRDWHYDFFIASMNRLVDHPYSYRVENFIMKFRNSIASSMIQEVPKLMFSLEGVPYMTANGQRKTSVAEVTLFGGGTGQLSINNQDIHYFNNIQEREQVIFPLQFTGLLGRLDVVAQVEGGGTCSQAGAIRLAIAKAARSFVDKETIEKMRLAGLLTRDPRRRERKKPGQKGARAKFTWKKR